MRFKITLIPEHVAFGNEIPLNYQYELSSFIYRTLARSDSGYSAWLHENGFLIGTKRFKLFSFSNLLLPAYKIHGDRINIQSQKVELIVSFLPERSTEEFIRGLFTEQSFCLGDKVSKVQFRVSAIELLPDPPFVPGDEFTTLSPVCITRKENGSNRIIYESPETQYAGEALLFNLKNKYKAFTGNDIADDAGFHFQLTSQPRSKLIAIKTNTEQQTKVKGYLFNFRISAPPELMAVMYGAGLGEKGSLGFGQVISLKEFKIITTQLKKS